MTTTNRSKGREVAETAMSSAESPTKTKGQGEGDEERAKAKERGETRETIKLEMSPCSTARLQGGYTSKVMTWILPPVCDYEGCEEMVDVEEWIEGCRAALYT